MILAGQECIFESRCVHAGAFATLLACTLLCGCMPSMRRDISLLLSLYLLVLDPDIITSYHLPSLPNPHLYFPLLPHDDFNPSLLLSARCLSSPLQLNVLAFFVYVSVVAVFISLWTPTTLFSYAPYHHTPLCCPLVTTRLPRLSHSLHKPLSSSLYCYNVCANSFKTSTAALNLTSPPLLQSSLSTWSPSLHHLSATDPSIGCIGLPISLSHCSPCPMLVYLLIYTLPIDVCSAYLLTIDLPFNG